MAFASVSISAAPARATSVKAASGGRGGGQSKAWVRASLSGARAVLKYLAQHDLLNSRWQIRVDEIGGSISDTSPDAIECASGLATWQALAGEIAAPKVRRNGRFYLEFPPISGR